MGSLRTVLPFLLLLLLEACGSGVEQPWVSVEKRGETLIVRGAAVPGTHSTLFLARPRTADRPPPAGKVEIAFELTPDDPTELRVLARTTPQENAPVELTLPLVATARGFFVIQWVVTGDPKLTGPVAGVSKPVYLRRHAGRWDLHGAWAYLWLAHRETWLRLATAAAVILVLLVLQRWVRPRPLAFLVAATASGAVLVFVSMRAIAIPDQWALDSGINLPAFHITSSWTFDDDSEERVLGPGFRELEELIRSHRLPGEKLYFHITDDELGDVSMARSRASYLRREFPDGVMVFLHDDAGPGLSVFFGSTPRGTVLASGRLAVLTRIGSESK